MVSLLLGWLGILYGWVPRQIFNYKCITYVCMICYDSLLGFITLLNSSKSISSPWSSFKVFRTTSLSSKFTWQLGDAICSNNNSSGKLAFQFPDLLHLIYASSKGLKWIMDVAFFHQSIILNHMRMSMGTFNYEPSLLRHFDLQYSLFRVSTHQL